MSIAELQTYYSGFWIKEPKGNNAFSYDKRMQKEIWVPPLINGGLDDVKIGDHIVFSEFEDVEHNKLGLKSFVYYSWQGKHVFIFDNHNHAFCFWIAAFHQKVIDQNTTLLHVDQHKDMREPDHYLQSIPNLSQAFEYTNNVLNVGNFIKPALNLKLFDDVVVVDDSQSLKRDYDFQVLDLDLDFFSSDMDYIDHDLKLNRIRHWAQQSKFITIATSPYFIDQNKAINVLQQIFA